MDGLRVLRCNKGAASLSLILGIIAMIVTIGCAMVFLANAETHQSQIDRAGNEAYFVADSGRRIAEQCLQLYMLGSVKQGIQMWRPDVAAPSTNPSEDPVGDIAESSFPIEILELGGIDNEDVYAADGETIVTKFGHYRVDMYGTQAGASANKLVPSLGEIWNNIAPTTASAERLFDAEMTVEMLDTPVEATDYWNFPLRFRIDVQATAPLIGDKRSRHTITGRGTVNLYIRKDKTRSWADCMEYTTEYARESFSTRGEPVMTGRDVYNGPVHTGGTLRFSGNPVTGSVVGTTFFGAVTTSKASSLFWVNGVWESSSTGYYPPNAKNKYDVLPQYKAGFFPNTVSSTAWKTTNPDFLVKVVGVGVEPGATTDSTINIYLPIDAAAGVLGRGGIYVVGDCGIRLTRDGTKQIYEFTHYNIAGAVMSPTSLVTVDYENNVTIVHRMGESAPRSLVGLPNVIEETGGAPFVSENAIYVRGRVKSLQGDLAEATRLSIMASGYATSPDGQSIRITGDLRYQVPPSLSSLSPNILGLFSEYGNIAVASGLTGATIHAHIMTLQGEFYCEDYDQLGRGTLEVLGSIASKRAGPVGTVAGAGYAKAYTWDTRATFAPPPLYLTEKKEYSVTIERPDSPGHSTWRVVWASESL